VYIDKFVKKCNAKSLTNVRLVYVVRDLGIYTKEDLEDCDVQLRVTSFY